MHANIELRQPVISPTAEDACQFVESCYASRHGADILCTYPELMVASTAEGVVRAVAGFRSSSHRFHLEHYLDSPAQVVVSDAFNQHYDRSELVEVGSLSGGCDRRATAALMHALWHQLVDDGYQVILLTGTQSLLHRFRHFPLQRLGKALPHRVPNASSWGRYYEEYPEVVAGKLHAYDSRFRIALPPDLLITRVDNSERST